MCAAVDESGGTATQTHTPKQSGVQDGNTGLVKLALAAHAMRAIQRLTQTYLTLPLAAIAAEAGLPSAADAEHYLLRCVTRAVLCALPCAAKGIMGIKAAGSCRGRDFVPCVSQHSQVNDFALSVAERYHCCATLLLGV